MKNQDLAPTGQQMNGVDLPQHLKQTYGCQCRSCGALWDGHQVPCPIDVALRIMEANRKCWKCGSNKTYSLMPWKYEELKAASEKDTM